MVAPSPTLDIINITVKTINWDRFIENGKLGSFVNRFGGILWVSADAISYSNSRVYKSLQAQQIKQTVSCN